MKTVFYVTLALSFSTALYFAGINMENPLPLYVSGSVLGIGLCLWTFSRNSKKAAQRKYRERMFQQHMRMTLRNQWH
jgi:putative effector of murein hydrolase LrgA (UPF0299 family)